MTWAKIIVVLYCIVFYCIVFTADIFDEVDAQLEEYGIACECVGGGTILHDPQQKSLQIFGRSQVK